MNIRLFVPELLFPVRARVELARAVPRAVPVALAPEPAAPVPVSLALVSLLFQFVGC